MIYFIPVTGIVFEISLLSHVRFVFNPNYAMEN